MANRNFEIPQAAIDEFCNWGVTDRNQFANAILDLTTQIPTMGVVIAEWGMQALNGADDPLMAQTAERPVPAKLHPLPRQWDDPCF